MVLSHNQMAYVAIVTTMIFGALFVGVSGVIDSTILYEGAEDDILDDQDAQQQILDSDGDGLSDTAEQTIHGTDHRNSDTDADGLSDGWEVANGMDPLDPGDAGEDEANTLLTVDSECTEEGVSFSVEQTTQQRSVIIDGEEVQYNITYLHYTLPNGISKTVQESEPWVPKNGVYELDDGKFIISGNSVVYCTGTPLPDDGGSPDNGPDGDPDKDGLTNEQEFELGTNPNLRDTDADGLNDKWESDHMHERLVPGTTEIYVTLFNPLDGNWDCPLLTEDRIDEVETLFETDLMEFESVFGADFNGRYSCDAVLDVDAEGPDGVINFLEELFGTNPLAADSDSDLLSDFEEISHGTLTWTRWCGRPLGAPIERLAPFTSISNGDIEWFLEDMDGDGYSNGPSDWDTDGDGMPDGFEHCFSSALDHPTDADTTQLLRAANNSDAYYDWDGDDLYNLEEYQVAALFGPENFTSPWLIDTDGDGMEDGWEKEYGLHPAWAGDKYQDPDLDGWDQNGNGAVTYSDMTYNARVSALHVVLGQQVQRNQKVATAQITLPGGVKDYPEIYAPVDGFVYEIHVEVDDLIESRLDVWMTIVEEHERFTNIDEYNAKFKDGVIESRSTDPMNPDTDADGLKDGIEVHGWNITVISGDELDDMTRLVTSDPGLYDTDGDGLSDYEEFHLRDMCELGSNASNADTDSDGLDDYFEAVNGHQFLGGEYFTSPCMYDTDNDRLRDGEEVTLGEDGFVTNASDRDTDDDGLKDGYETMYIPRPFHTGEFTDPLNNDTDGDGMMDGWEMQVESLEDNTRSHSLWVAVDLWDDPTCEIGHGEPSNKCTRDPGGYLWGNWLGGAFDSSPTYEIHELNLTNFQMPSDVEGRWALNPMFGSLPDVFFDIDNDTLLNSMEAPDRWDTNPVVKDTDGDGLPDGWEVMHSELAMNLGLVDNATLGSVGARGVLDPKLYDSDNDGIPDGDEDLDHDGLNRTSLLNRYCRGWNNNQSSECHINPSETGGDWPGKRFYDDLENYTNLEEFMNGTNPVLNDTDGDGWEDGPEVYYQDHDDDGMATGWEFHFDFNPFNNADRTLDTDHDGYKNWCEFKWDTNPRDSTSFPGQGQLCDDWT